MYATQLRDLEPSVSVLDAAMVDSLLALKQSPTSPTRGALPAASALAAPRRATKRAATNRGEDGLYRCPAPGCTKVYSNNRSLWGHKKLHHCAYFESQAVEDAGDVVSPRPTTTVDTAAEDQNTCFGMDDLFSFLAHVDSAIQVRGVARANVASSFKSLYCRPLLSSSHHHHTCLCMTKLALSPQAPRMSWQRTLPPVGGFLSPPLLPLPVRTRGGGAAAKRLCPSPTSILDGTTTTADQFAPPPAEGGCLTASTTPPPKKSSSVKASSKGSYAKAVTWSLPLTRGGSPTASPRSGAVAGEPSRGRGLDVLAAISAAAAAAVFASPERRPAAQQVSTSPDGPPPQPAYVFHPFAAPCAETTTPGAGLGGSWKRVRAVLVSPESNLSSSDSGASGGGNGCGNSGKKARRGYALANASLPCTSPCKRLPRVPTLAWGHPGAEAATSSREASSQAPPVSLVTPNAKITARGAW